MSQTDSTKADDELVEVAILDEDDPTDDEITTASNERLTDSDIENRYLNLSLRVVYQSNNFFLPQIKELLKGDEVINIRPEYQRRLRWSVKKKSLLIESLLLNIPVPPVFLYESDLARYEVMDGQQRLNAVYEFLTNDMTLRGLEKLKFLNGRSYLKLPPKVKRSLDRASISAIVLLRETKSDEADPYIVRRYVFERLNTGGENLNPQELRNSLYRGKFNDLIVKLTRGGTFCRVFGIPEYIETDENDRYENPDRQKNTLYKKMIDCQIVLRFFALMKDDDIHGSMHSILDSCMLKHEKITEAQLAENEALFNKILGACYEVMDEKPFLLPPDKSGKQRVSVALFDACMSAFYRNQDQLDIVKENKRSFQTALDDLLRDNLDLLTARANTGPSIKGRISAIDKIIKSITS